MAFEEVTLVNVKIVFRNFAGKGGTYNREGNRNFGVLLNDAIAKQLEKDGWHVKYLKVREEGETPQPWIKVSVSYKVRPPRVVMLSSRGRNTLTEDGLEFADWVDIRTADLRITKHEGEFNGTPYVKAYLRSLFLTIEEDELDLKYADYEELPARAGRVEE